MQIHKKYDVTVLSTILFKDRSVPVNLKLRNHTLFYIYLHFWNRYQFLISTQKNYNLKKYFIQKYSNNSKNVFHLHVLNMKCTGCLNIDGTHVTDNPTNNNIVFLFVSNLKIVNY